MRLRNRNKGFRRAKILAIVWALLLGLAVIIIGGSVLLPSTKRARFDFTQQRGQALSEAATTNPATLPTTQP